MDDLNAAGLDILTWLIKHAMWLGLWMTVDYLGSDSNIAYSLNLTKHLVAL